MLNTSFENDLIALLVKISKNSLISIHIDSIGFFNYPIDTEEKLSIEQIINLKLKSFGKVLLEVERLGGNILIPTYSHSYHTDEVNFFDYMNSPSVVGYATEFFRAMFPKKRSIDPMFSYLVFSQNTKFRHFEFKDEYESMGDDSLMAGILDSDGYILSIGNVLRRITEAHFLERKMGVNYRYNVTIQGKFLDQAHHLHDQKVIVFGRKSVLIADFSKILNDLEHLGLKYTWNVDQFKLEGIKFNDLFRLMKQKFELDQNYFVCTQSEKKQKDRGVF